MVADTNVFVAGLLAKSPESANKRIIQLWLQARLLQLILSIPVVEEYLGTFAEVIGMDRHRLTRWRNLFEQDVGCTLINLARRYTESRDPDDNLMLATAAAGGANYLISNDRDLLDLPDDFKRTLPFAIVTPRQFLDEFDR